MKKRVPQFEVGPLVFLAPALVLYAVFAVYPVVDSLRLSLFHWPNPAAPPEFCGLRNFAALAGDAVFWRACLHNALLIALSLAVQLPLAFLLAVLLSYPTRGRRLFRTALFAPMIMPTVAIAVLWSNLYLPQYGLLDQLIRLVDKDFAFGWLSEPQTAMACVFVTICWRYVGFHMVLYMAGIAAIDPTLYEAARMDGAGEWQLCRHVTLPLMGPTIGLSCLLSIIGSLKYFDLVYMLAGGAPETARELLATYIYRQAFAGGQGRYGYASAVAVVLFGAALLAGVILLRATRGRDA